MFIVISIVVMALVTYLVRVIPLTCFRKKVKSRYIRSFLYYVPYAVLGGMTFPHIFYSTENMIYAIIGTGVALLLGYLERGLTTVAVLSVLVVYLCNILL
ncbi:MAG: AzlD domain-containing protein [Candidatus Cellulosilyticum pullistercoris]|uniref:AzlD domain-containing protein n=1 Tax=Candidatus Cellulosilyticum pullistercoris TaxID=2838521 RepID=A0A9E2KBG3_9FIRM|nr:AzlD domain-containing protein [Candidatus Cellulosilyticum pullistercoris]